MLYDVMIGVGTCHGVWNQTSDDYGNPMIENSVVQQRIRIAKNFDPSDTYLNMEETVYEEGTDRKINYYKFKEGTRLVRNMNNMGMLLISNRKPDPNNFVYFTISNEDGYELLDYKTLGVEIINTYKKKDKYQGCLLQFDPKNLTDGFDEKEIPIFKVDLLKKGQIETIELVYDSDHNDILMSAYTNPSYYDTFLENHSDRKFLHFRMSDCEGFATNIIITSKKDAGTIKEIVKDVKIGSPEVVVLSDSDIKLIDQGAYKSSKELSKLIDENIIAKRAKAVTVYNVKLNKDFLRELNILYLFKYDKDENRSYVLRST